MPEQRRQGGITLPNQTSPPTPAAGLVTLFAKGDVLYAEGPSGIEHALGPLSQIGTAAARPAVTAVVVGTFYVATDTAGGTLYRSDGTNWVQIAAGVTAPGGGGTAAGTTYTANGTIVSTDVQAAITEVAGDASTALGTHEGDTLGVHGILDTVDLLVKSGGTMTGLLTLSGAPTAALHAATKAYVDGGGGAGISPTIVDEAGDLIVATGPDVVVRLARGAALNVLRTNADGTNIEWAAPATGVGGTASTVQEFTVSGNWTKPVGLVFATVIVISAGGGGGSGRRGAAASVRAGGGGGKGGGWTSVLIPAADLDAVETVTVGVGGNGGGAIAVDSTSGTAGGTGGNSAFGSIINTSGGGGGAGGTLTAGAGGSTGGIGKDSSGNGGNASTTGTGGLVGGTSSGAAGGGAGGGITSANISGPGGAGGIAFSRGIVAVSGGGNTLGGSGAALPAQPGTAGGMGGGGGGAGAAVGGSGAAGAMGSGGGGGAGSLNLSASGAGGAGGAGVVFVVCDF